MDLSLLPHLSDEALAAEAEGRGLSVEPASREALIEAIRSHERGTNEAPTEEEEEERSPTIPPPDASALGAAKAFFGKVAKIARSAIEKRDTQRPPAPPSVPETPDEPIQTRSMAKVLIEQGHLDRAHAMLRELNGKHPDDRGVAEDLRAVGAKRSEIALRRDARRTLENLDGAFIALVHHDAARAVVYRLYDRELERGRALLGAEGVPTLRVVTIEKHPDARVVARTDDQPLEEREGWKILDAAAAARLVVSVGLEDGGRFVSLLHATFQP